jgi:hypothetical protein
LTSLSVHSLYSYQNPKSTLPTFLPSGKYRTEEQRKKNTTAWHHHCLRPSDRRTFNHAVKEATSLILSTSFFFPLPHRESTQFHIRPLCPAIDSTPIRHLALDSTPRKLGCAFVSVAGVRSLLRCAFIGHDYL